MKLILLDNIRGVGQVGDIKEVNDGYARNFLLPRGIAKPVTPGTLKEVQAVKTKKLQSMQLAREQAQTIAATLAGTRVELTGRANAKGTLFAAITEVKTSAGVFALPEPIKTTGEHPVHLEIAEGVGVDLTVVILPQK